MPSQRPRYFPDDVAVQRIILARIGHDLRAFWIEQEPTEELRSLVTQIDRRQSEDEWGRLSWRPLCGQFGFGSSSGRFRPVPEFGYWPLSDAAFLNWPLLNF